MKDKKNKTMNLSVIVPAYNEAKTLRANVLGFYNYLKKQNFDFEIIIVNDGSLDDTEIIARILSSEFPRIKLISKKTNQGKGAAIRDGLLAGNGDFLLFLDADNATSIDHLEKVWPLFQDGYDLVIGSRNRADSQGAKQQIPQSLLKRLSGTIGNKLIKLFLDTKINDTQCGFKIFTKKSVDIIIPKTKICRWATDMEILQIAKKNKLRIGVIPVVWNCGPVSRVGFRGYFVALKEMLTIKRNDLMGKYD